MRNFTFKILFIKSTSLTSLHIAGEFTSRKSLLLFKIVYVALRFLLKTPTGKLSRQLHLTRVCRLIT